MKHTPLLMSFFLIVCLAARHLIHGQPRTHQILEAAAAAEPRVTTWCHWRGPEQTGVARDRDLPEKWSPDKGDNLIWKQKIGGRSTPLVMNGCVYLINKVGEGINEQERVMCLQADSGAVLWEYKFNVFHTDIVSVRLGWTNLAGDPETGNIYAHGTQGLLLCFSKDGQVLWSRSLTEEYGRISGYGGRVTSPVVDGDLVIIGMVNASWGDQARGGNRFLALDKKTGTPVWWSATGLPVKDTYYSCPVVAVINGERLLISGGADGAVHAFRVRTGEKVWSYLFGTGAVNCSPVVAGTRVYIGHGEENPDNNIQGRVICLDAGRIKEGKPQLVWQADDIKAKFASPIIHDGRLYVCDEGATLHCLDAASGTELWNYSYGTDCKGSSVWADGKIYVGEVDGGFHILKPGSDGCVALDSQHFRNAMIYGSPAVANGRIFFSTTSETFCIGKKDHKRPPDPLSPPAREDPAAANAKPARLQVVPADVVLEPGESAIFRVRAFDDRGRLLGEVKGDWSLAPQPVPAGAPAQGLPALKGDITPAGKLTVDRILPEQFGLVVVRAGNLTGQARVRVIAPPPYQPDFATVPAGRAPAGWINCQGKFAVQKKGDRQVLVKLATNASPLLARANAYIGKPTRTDYTIEADVMATQKGQDLPDMGVVANRYTLALIGSTQSLRLVSWDALPRVDKTRAWPWQPDVWYRMKLTVAVRGDKALVRGKVWPRQQPEPKEWTVEFEDPTPNREGSPGLYGNATGIVDGASGAEVYYDRVRVVPNKE